MARRPRQDAPGTLHHVHNRGARRHPIFIDDLDRQMFLSLLVKAVVRHEAEIHAYCLMGNHYHLLLYSRNGDLDRVMHYQSFQYVRYFNRRHGFDGPLYKDRFSNVLVTDDSYLLTLSRYIHRNPTDLSDAPLAQYRWSSYGAFLGRCRRPSWLHTKRTLDYFLGDPMRYRHFVEGENEGLVSAEQPFEPDHDTDPATSGGDPLSEVERAVVEVMDVLPSQLSQATPGRRNPSRLLACGLANALGVPSRDIADRFGFGAQSSVRSAIARSESLRAVDAPFADLWHRAVASLDLQVPQVPPHAA